MDGKVINPLQVGRDPEPVEGLLALRYDKNRPIPETIGTLMQELAFQRATQGYLWVISLISTLGMKYGSEEVFRAHVQRDRDRCQFEHIHRHTRN